METKKRKTALFGGKFDPPHLGHQLTIFLALEKYLMDEVQVIPSYSHPFGHSSSDYEKRCEMCEIMIRPWGNERVKVSRIEKEIGTETVYTVDLIKYILKKETSLDLHLFIGEDNWKCRDKWKNFEEIRKLVKIIVVGRGENSSNNFSLPDISSTMIREMIKNGTDPSPLLPHGVMEYLTTTSA
jgi:nicotinate-nucleotide adenylyltransferase